MDEKSETPQVTGEGSWDKAEKGIKTVFDGIALAQMLLPQEANEQRKIAILGAGSAVEAKPLQDHFVENGLEVPQIKAYDSNPAAKIMSDSFSRAKGVTVDYKIAELTDSATLEGEEFDLVIVRKPDVHADPAGWRKIITRGFEHLKPGGVFLFTATEDKPYDMFRQVVGNRGSIRSYPIARDLQQATFFPESELLIAQKNDSVTQTPQLPQDI